MRISFLAAFILIFAVFSAQTQAKEFYKWIDDDGVTHYTVEAPKDRPSTLVRTQVGGGADSGSTNAVSASRALPGDETGSTGRGKPVQAEKPEVEMTAIDPQRCNVARANIATLGNHARIKVTDSDGSIRYLTEAERADKTAEAEEAVRESCE